MLARMFQLMDNPDETSHDPGIEPKVKPLQTFNPESPDAVPETESSNDPKLLSAPATETASAPKLKLVASAER